MRTAWLQVITVPITIGLERPEIMGVLAFGFRLDNELAAQFKRATESDIAFAVDGRYERRLSARRSRPADALLNDRAMCRRSPSRTANTWR